ncbi:MAG: efflux RND transporter periplasmic adaptor subunit [Pseudomonadota bacterium]
MRISSLIIALVAVAGLYYWFGVRGQTVDVSADAGTPSAEEVALADAESPTADQPSKNERPVPVMVLPVQSRETEARLVLRGRTKANRNVQLVAETEGQVISEPLRSGTRVEIGQVLCRLNPGVRAAQLAEAEASLAEAEVEASATTQLKAKGFAAETTLNARRARLEAAQARLDQVNWDIGRLEIKAPFSGVLETDTAEIGTFLSQGAYCANIIDLSRIKISGFVGEQNVDLLSLGQTASARLINGTEVSGEISFVSRVADEQTRTYAVEVTLDNPGWKIRDGMTAELLIDLPSEAAHLVPQSALTLDDGGRMGVRVAEDGKARFFPVRIMRDTAEGVWVDGLPDTADVIVIGQEFVRNGRTVIATPIDSSALR